jgi:APA family basic amino acid/polyamine antiporter
MRALWRTKSIEQLQAEAEAPSGFARSLGAFDLTLLGIGCIIGTGVFVLTGRAAAANAGPAVALSFAIGAGIAALAALCYAEMASMIPVAGSAYTYAYATLGELVAWLLGWDLILEYLVGAATVGVGWSGYVRAFLEKCFAIELPARWCHAPVTYDPITGSFAPTGSVANLPAGLIILGVTAVLVVGTQQSARLNSIIVAIKLTAIGLFILFASPHVDPANWHPFIVPNAGAFGAFGWSGVFQGAVMVFFSYVGFDAVSTAAQEARNPQRDLPIGILASLVVCSGLYIAVALVLTGVISYTKLGVDHPVALGVAATGQGWLEAVVDLGAIAGLTSVMLVMLMAMPRIFYAMAQDGLVPPFAGRLHPRFKTPHLTTLGAGVVCALASGLLPVETLGELSSLGTLLAFMIVSAGIIVLRRRRPDLRRGFRVPGGAWLLPGLSVACTLALMGTATTPTLLRLGEWMLLGLVVYLAYGRRHAKLGLTAQPPGASSLP